MFSGITQTSGWSVAVQREPGDDWAFRIHFSHLLDFVLDGRQLDYAFVGGSVPPSSNPLWKRFENLGIDVEKQSVEKRAVVKSLFVVPSLPVFGMDVAAFSVDALFRQNWHAQEP